MATRSPVCGARPITSAWSPQPGTSALDERVVLILANWSYAGTGYTTRLPGAALALVSANLARGH